MSRSSNGWLSQPTQYFPAASGKVTVRTYARNDGVTRTYFRRAGGRWTAVQFDAEGNLLALVHTPTFKKATSRIQASLNTMDVEKPA